MTQTYFIPKTPTCKYCDEEPKSDFDWRHHFCEPMFSSLVRNNALEERLEQINKK